MIYNVLLISGNKNSCSKKTLVRHGRNVVLKKMRHLSHKVMPVYIGQEGCARRVSTKTMNFCVWPVCLSTFLSIFLSVCLSVHIFLHS